MTAILIFLSGICLLNARSSAECYNGRYDSTGYTKLLQIDYTKAIPTYSLCLSLCSINQSCAAVSYDENTSTCSMSSQPKFVNISGVKPNAFLKIAHSDGLEVTQQPLTTTSTTISSTAATISTTPGTSTSTTTPGTTTSTTTPGASTSTTTPETFASATTPGTISTTTSETFTSATTPGTVSTTTPGTIGTTTPGTISTTTTGTIITTTPGTSTSTTTSGTIITTTPGASTSTTTPGTISTTTPSTSTSTTTSGTSTSTTAPGTFTSTTSPGTSTSTTAPGTFTSTTSPGTLTSTTTPGTSTSTTAPGTFTSTTSPGTISTTTVTCDKRKIDLSIVQLGHSGTFNGDLNNIIDGEMNTKISASTGHDHWIHVTLSAEHQIRRIVVLLDNYDITHNWTVTSSLDGSLCDDAELGIKKNGRRFIAIVCHDVGTHIRIEYRFSTNVGIHELRIFGCLAPNT